MAVVKSVATQHCVGYLCKRLRSIRLLLLILSLWLSGMLFVNFSGFNFSELTNILLSRQRIEIEGSKSPDKSVHTSFYPTTESSGIHENIHNISSDTPMKVGKGHDTPKSKVKDGCTFPKIDPFDPAVMALTKFYPPISCDGGVPLLVYLNGDSVKVNHSKTAFVGNMENRFKECRYKSITKAPGSDFKTVVLHTSDPFNDSITLRENDDNVVVECYDSNNTVLSRSYFSLIRVKKDLEILLEENYKKHIAMHAPKEVLSVLMIGIDGNSKQNFQRHMPKTRNYLLNVLNATELHKYNKVADHTYVNLVPLLAGKYSYELESHKFDDHFDTSNEEFLWSDFRRIGYRTGVFFDDSVITAFHFFKKGWDKPPVDYYHRATILELERDKLMKSQGMHCVGDIPEITFNNNFWIQMASTFNNSKTRPYFGFSFSTHLTHDDHNGASAGDDLYLSFLQELKDKNIINNTVIVFFSDHGERFGKVRSTYNGMIEAMTPYVFLVFPPWFHRKYPDLMKVLKINQDRLTTNTDVYETLRDLLNFQATTSLGNVTKRGISLFQEIPLERTCNNAGIIFNFCVCNQLTQANVSSDVSFALALAVQDKLRTFFRTRKHICEELFVKSVESVMIIQPDHQTGDTATENDSLYQITLTTRPNDALYEARLAVPSSTKKIRIIGDIIRLDMYRGQADCVDDPKIKPFCFCKK